MTPDVYDSDDALNRSPLLKAQVIKYQVEDPQPPFAKRWHSGDGRGDSHSTMGSPSRSSRKRGQQSKPLTNLADAVLISHLDPNRPDIATEARENPLEYDQRPEDGGEPPIRSSHQIPGLSEAASKALSLLPDGQQPVAFPADPQVGLPDNSQTLKPDWRQRTVLLSTNSVEDPNAARIKKEPKSPRFAFPPHHHLKPPSEINASEDSLATSPLGKFTISPSERPVQEHLPAFQSRHPLPSEDSLATSPLGKFTISPSERPVQEHLPALQSRHPLPQSAAGSSPDNVKSLPSLQATLGEQLSEPARKDHPGRPPHPFPPISTTSPLTLGAFARERSLSGPCQLPPSPYPHHLSPVSSKDFSGLSPPASLGRPTPTTLKPELAYPIDQPARSPQMVKSPSANYPTPTERKPEETEPQPFPTPGSAQSNGHISGNGQYRCTYPGCTATSFQTQYLLNSHANVHSTERPHFCPVTGCNRGEGGKGFKRKNEMIRHGLVHDSPGYVCPFCPNQQHRYPRPDNLQR
ncbi:hypothetical protein Egran_03541 [Elaphomyces granulatus]|uniref:C2H2-type domain-containing protein n=1 Tax=Elaphomyces granulatus TaxID=519963 RepID=A0A232LX61_9EURO|nr:hypothetical protein Egran_03541 [Elaphomyces granulatus]